MKRLALILALTTALPVHAGGPVVVEEEPETIVAGDTAQRVNPLVIIGGLVVACLILCGSDDDPAPVAAPPSDAPPPVDVPPVDPGKPDQVCYSNGC